LCAEERKFFANGRWRVWRAALDLKLLKPLLERLPALQKAVGAVRGFPPMTAMKLRSWMGHSTIKKIL